MQPDTKLLHAQHKLSQDLLDQQKLALSRDSRIKLHLHRVMLGRNERCEMVMVS